LMEFSGLLFFVSFIFVPLNHRNNQIQQHITTQLTKCKPNQNASKNNKTTNHKQLTH